MANSINWFEIPAANIDRAAKFYGDVLGTQLPRQEIMGTKMAMIPATDHGVGGALCAGDGYKPTSDGAIVYLNGGDDLSGPLARVEKAGGKVIVPKTKISDEVGYFAMFHDSEGNRVALHSLR